MWSLFRTADNDFYNYEKIKKEAAKSVSCRQNSIL